jgi:hypothetical protein
MIPQPPPFFLIVADHRLRVFSVEGPMTDDRPWQLAALRAREQGLHIVCGPAGWDSTALIPEFPDARKMVRVQPGSIVRPNR